MNQNQKQSLSVKEKSDLILRSLVGEKGMDAWWNSPNKAFGMQKPIDVPAIEVFNYLLDQMEAPH